MKRIVVMLLAICAVTAACQKPVKAPLSYKIESAQNTVLGDIYIPDNGTYVLPVQVKYMTGYSEEKVTVSIKGLPPGVTVVQDTFKEVPTYRADFALVSKNATHGSYPATVTSSAAGSDPKSYTFNIIVRSADCASNLWGDFACSNECTARKATYTAKGIGTGVTDQLTVANLGGYGDNTIATVILDCNQNTLTVPSQNIGNGVVLSGTGTFTGNSMKISYTATFVSGAPAETCNATMTKK